MKNVLVFMFVCFSFTTVKSQVTKENICKGAALSIVYTMDAAVKSEMKPVVITEITNRSFKEVIHPYVKKTYDLLKSGKDRKAVIPIIEADLLKLDDDVVFKGLLLGTNDD